MITVCNWSLFVGSALGVLIGVVYCKNIFSLCAGNPPKVGRFTQKPVIFNGSLVIKLGKSSAVHLHHWTLCFVVLLLLAWLAPLNAVTILVAGFFLTLMIQGLLYPDCFAFLVPNPYN